MSRIITSPAKETVIKWGPLAYVSEAERERIMNSPGGEFKREVKRLEREIAEAKKKYAKR